MKDHDNDAIAYVSGGLAQYIVGAESHKRYMEDLQEQPLDHDKQRQIMECLILQARSTGEATISLAELLVLRHHYDGLLSGTDEADAWCEYWRREALRKHPTPEAYELVCKARDKWQQQAERVEQERDFLASDEYQAITIKAMDNWAAGSIADRKRIQDLEQERDEYRVIADGYAADIRAAHDRWLELTKAKNAMRAELEWYAQTDLGTRAEDLLARYPQGGEAPVEIN